MRVAVEAKPLTPAQAEVLRYIYEQVLDRGYQPGIRQIQTHLGYANHNAVQTLLAYLDRKGYIQRTGEFRAIRLLRWPDGAPFTGLMRPPT